jgi:hypothetical protein
MKNDSSSRPIGKVQTNEGLKLVSKAEGRLSRAPKYGPLLGREEFGGKSEKKKVRPFRPDDCIPFACTFD